MTMTEQDQQHEYDRAVTKPAAAPLGDSIDRGLVMAIELLAEYLADKIAAEVHRRGRGVAIASDAPADTWDPLESTCRHASLSIL